MTTITTKFCIELEFEIEAEYQAGDPGKTSGPPEGCYPPEPEVIEIEDLKRIGIPFRFYETNNEGKLIPIIGTKWIEIKNNDFAWHLREFITNSDELRQAAEDAVREEAMRFDE